MSPGDLAPLFVAVEGIDRSGKTTLVRRLMKYLQEQEIPAASFKEPGDDNPIGRAFREISKLDALPPLTVATLLAAERHWNSKRVREWLGEGRLVVADRYYLSGLVYCRAEGISFAELARLHKGILKPDLYIWLKVPYEVAVQRRRRAGDRWEQEGIAQKAAEIYPEAFKFAIGADRADVAVVDGTGTRQNVLEAAFAALVRRCARA